MLTFVGLFPKTANIASTIIKNHVIALKEQTEDDYEHNIIALNKFLKENTSSKTITKQLKHSQPQRLLQ